MPSQEAAQTFWRQVLLITLIERMCDLTGAEVMPWYILDAERRPVRCHSIVEWGRFTESRARIVGEDLVAGGRLNTSCVGWDMSPKMTLKGREPVTFETMGFNLDDPADTRTLGRYFTWAEAERGHAALLLSIQAAFAEDPSCWNG
jgi:hypothetical protein